MQSIIKKLSFQTVVYGYLLALVFLLPFIFSAGSSLSFQISKTIPLLVFVVLGISYIVYTAFKEGRLVYSTNVPVISLIALPIVYVISAFFNHTTASGLMGAGFDTDTASFTLLLVLSALIASTVVRTRERAFYVFSAFGLSFGLLALYHLVRMFAPEVIYNLISPSIFAARTANTLGKWTEIGLLAGIVSITACVSIEFLKMSRVIKTLLYILLVVSLILVLFINFPVAIWGSFVFSYASLVGLFSLILFIYLLSSTYSHSTEGEVKKRQVPYASLIVFIVGMLATLGYGQINAYIFNATSVPRTTVNYTIPTWQETTNTAWNALKDKKLLGVGPDNFSDYFNLHRPDEINVTNAWNTEFKGGFSYVLTSVVTTGIPALVVWLVLIVSLIYAGFRTLFGQNRDAFTSYIMTLSYVSAIGFMCALILYNPSHAVLALAFIFIGVYMGMLFQDGQLREQRFVFEDSKKKSFVTILSLVFVLIFGVIWVYSYGEKVLAASYVNQASKELAQNSPNSIKNAQQLIYQARQITPYDEYDKALLQLQMNEAVTYLSQNKNSADTVRNVISGLAAQIAATKESMQKYNPDSASNDLFIAQAYQTFVPGVPDAYQLALDNYNSAQAKYPNSPFVKFSLASLNLAQGTEDSVKLATQNLVDAIKLKGNYQDAYFLLARALSAQGDKQTAIQSVRAGASLTPNEPVVLFQLGLVEYGAGNYAEAEADFKQALAYAGNQDVSSVNYYLALTYYAQKRTDEAVAKLEEVIAKYPDSEDVKKVLDNVKNGRSVFSGVSGQASLGNGDSDKSTVTGDTAAGSSTKTSSSTKATATSTKN